MHQNRATGLLALVLFACSPSPAEEVSQAPDASGLNASARDGDVPEFKSVDEAIEYATRVENLLAYQGVVYGSESYDVELPTGESVSNWQVDCFFRDLFGGFGGDAYPKLAPLLNHDLEYVQVGAYAVLNSTMSKHGLKRRVDDSREERAAMVTAVLETVSGSSD